MATTRCTLLLLLLTVHGSIQKSNPANPTYKAAIVEIKPVSYKDDPARTLNENADKLVSFIEQAANKDADIIVFPELVLSAFFKWSYLDAMATAVPDLYMPCINSSIPISKALKKIACAAEKKAIYVVVNLVEKDLCPKTANVSSDRVCYYITNVVLDRNGKIIGRSRKFHLFGGYEYVAFMPKPELSTFDTDFGVTFANVVCFDIMFDTWVTETRKRNITDVIFAPRWDTELPFLSSVQMEAGWAYVEDVNLLASGYNNIDKGFSGSAIHAGRQGLVAAEMSLDGHEKLLVADVWKKSRTAPVTPTARLNHAEYLNLTNTDHEHHVQDEHHQSNNTGRFKWRYEKLDAFASDVIAEDGATVKRLSHGEVDCEFQVNVTNLSPPATYRLLAFDGTRKFGDSTVVGYRVCAIVQCANDTIDSCGHISDTSTIFNSVKVTATYVDNGRTIMMPNTLRTDLLPFQNWSLDEYRSEQRTIVSITLTSRAYNPVTFGLWGRNFEKDSINIRPRV